jgi:hypothetical protein
VVIEGGLYHVYNRFARGEDVFADPEEAIEFVDLLLAPMHGTLCWNSQTTEIGRFGEDHAMALQVEITPAVTHLLVLVSGSFSLEEAKVKFPALVSACRTFGLSKVIVDFRSVSGNIAATEKILYALDVHDHYEQHIAAGGENLKIAFLGSPPLVSTYEPGHEVALEAGLPTDIFTDLSEACEWLGVPEQLDAQGG